MRLALDGEHLRVSAPRGVLTAALRRRIADGKSDIIGMLCRCDAVIPPVAGDGPAPLSFAQERLWLLEELEPGSAVFNLSRAARIAGGLDPRALETAFRELLRRHAALRTKFTAVDGKALQTVSPRENFALERIDLSALPQRKREKRCEQLLSAAARRPFDLTRDSLLRCSLIELHTDEHVLIFSTHHIVADAWSMSILSRELWSLYKEFSSGRPVALPEAAIRYRDYAVWQRREFDDAFLEDDRNYWTRQLADAPELDLPADRPRPAKRNFSSARRYFSFSEKWTAALNDLSRRAGATPFMTLLAAFQVLLYRYTGQEDIFVGAAAANRDQPELERVVGLFVNTLVLRGDLSGEPSFHEFLRRVRETCLEAYRHQSMPFEKVIEAINPERGLDRTPLFRAFFVMQNTPEARPEPPARLSLTPIEVESGTAQFDLSLYLRERQGKLIGFLECSTAVFDPLTIERMAGHFENLLEGIIADPGRSISILPMVGAVERRRLLVEWNDTVAEHPRDRCIHELFERQAERTPDRIALEFGDERLTYSALNESANAIAHELMRRGAGPGALVGVMLEPGFDMVSGLLAVLKSGAAYVPLDPSYPQERLRFMTEDAGVEMLLTGKKFAGELRTSIVLPIDDRDFAKKHRPNPPRLVDSESLAYVIYTSGSTGVPKGVMAPHRAAVNRFAWMWKTFPFERGEKNCQKTLLSFVDSVWEIFGGLLQGVATALVPDALAKDPESLVDYLMEHRVTRLVAVPSLLDAILLRRDAAEKLARLKFCFSSGEALSAELAERFCRLLPGCRLINLYGSSEVAADVTYAEIGSDTSVVPIGRPIHNTRIYLLGPGMEPVPVGACGELYVGGDGLARGYLNRPELTAEKFVADPFSPDRAARLFCTGDLARYRGDGNLEFLGRADARVKIRGRRIEPGEIEAVLGRHPSVRESVVVTQPGRDGSAWEAEMRLIGYVVPREEDRPEPRELRSFLSRTLPEFMVPAAFVWLDALPRLPNGKVDRRLLPRSEDFQPGELGKKTAPRTEAETLIAQVWRDVLGIDDIGVDDNFFVLGGHSLLAAQVAAKMREVFQRPVALRDVFQAPTVAGLAVLATRSESEAGNLPAIVRKHGKRPTRLSFGQEQMFVLSQLLGGADFLNLPYGYRLDGSLDRPALKKAMEEMIARHEILRTAFIDDSAGAHQIVRRRAAFKFPFTDLADLPKEKQEAELEAISKADAARAFDLETAPLFRATLIRLAERRHVLLITLHHLIADQWSMGVLRRELAALYEAFSQDRPAQFPALPFQFADFATWQRHMIECGGFDRQIKYWKNSLKLPAPRLDFQRGVKRKSAPRFQSARAPLRFEAGLLNRIKSFGREQGCTPFMVFVAALAILLRFQTGARDIRIGTLIANRGQPGADSLIGYFVNSLVLCLHVAPAMTVRELLHHVRAVCLEAYAHQDLPFEHLESLLERKQKRTPLYQVMLNYRNLWTPALKANGLTIAPWDGKYRASDPGLAISRLDVNFSIRELSTELTGAVTYKTDLFDARHIARLLADYSATLKRMLTSPEQRIS